VAHLSYIKYGLMCVSVRASLHMRREEKLASCHCMVYCTYNTLNMFGALLRPSSGARDYICVITVCGVQRYENS